MLPLALLGACIPVLYSDGEADGPWVAPVNGWPMGEPPEGLESEGFDIGQVIPDFRLPDQNSEDVSLWQFYGSVVLVDVSTMWCAPCQELAADVQDTADEYRDEGFIYVTILAQDLVYEVPDEGDLDEWAEGFGIDEPVLSDPDGWSTGVVPGAGFPGILLVDRDMEIVARLTASDALIRDAIEEIL